MAAASPESAFAGGQSNFLIRALSWCLLLTLFTFLVNNYLTVSMDWPGISPFFSDLPITAHSWLQLGLYALGLLAAVAYVRKTSARSLRVDSERIARFNAFLIRAAFWAVFLVGLVDAGISFLRVEGLLDHFFSQDMISELGRAQFRGPYIHLPLMLLGLLIAAFTRSLGFIWLTLLIVIAELTIVFTRFVFSYEQAFMGDLVRFWYGALFLFASAFTLFEDGHVRVDVLYSGFKDRAKGRVNAIGAILLGIIFCWVVIILGMENKSSIINAPLIGLEVTQNGFGMFVKYLMAGFLGVFAVSMMIAFCAQLLEGVADWRGDPGSRLHAHDDELPGH